MRAETKKFWARCAKVQQAEPDEEITNLEGSLYAVLFNAKDGRHSRDLRFVYNSLVNNGVKTGNIIILESNGSTRNKFVNLPATIGSLNYALEFIRIKANPNDKLLVYTANAGYISSGKCRLLAYEKTINEDEFADLTKDLPVNFSLFYFSNDYSGALAERIGNRKNIAIASAASDEINHSWFWRGCDFTYQLFPKILKKGITIEKAFDQAVWNSTNIIRRSFMPYIETPQLRWQNADPAKLHLGSI